MITGHYHLGEIYNLNNGKLAVLGDWFYRPSYAKFDGKDLSMNLWEEKCLKNFFNFFDSFNFQQLFYVLEVCLGKKQLVIPMILIF